MSTSTFRSRPPFNDNYPFADLDPTRSECCPCTRHPMVETPCIHYNDSSPSFLLDDRNITPSGSANILTTTSRAAHTMFSPLQSMVHPYKTSHSSPPCSPHSKLLANRVISTPHHFPHHHSRALMNVFYTHQSIPDILVGHQICKSLSL
jgi:hypothetical protein